MYVDMYSIQIFVILYPICGIPSIMDTQER